MPGIHDYGALVAFVGGLLVSAIGGFATAAWHASRHVAIIQDHARRLAALEAENKAVTSAVSLVDARLARIETALSFIAAQLQHGRGVPDLFGSPS